MIITGKDLKTVLRALDITQQEAADRIGVSRQTIVTWVGKSTLDDNTCQIVKSKLGVDLHHIVETNRTLPTNSLKIQNIIKQSKKLRKEEESSYEVNVLRNPPYSQQSQLNDPSIINRLLDEKDKRLVEKDDFYTTLIEEKDERLKDKDCIIDSKEMIIKDKEEIINLLKQQLDMKSSRTKAGSDSNIGTL